MDYRSILINLGYQPTINGRELRMRPIYRDSDNNTSLCVYTDDGSWVDFGSGFKGKFEELVKISLKLSSLEEAKQVLHSKFDFERAEIKKEITIKEPKIFDESSLDELAQNHSYWVSRGINEETIKLFKGGIAIKGRMKGRYCIPIFDNNRIIGYTGRTLNGSEIKYKHLGAKNLWCFPSHLNDSIIRDCKKVILVESPACIFKLWDNGIKNVLCLFGTECSVKIINYLISVDPDKILVSLNNEPTNNSIGNKAAAKLVAKLRKYFDYNQVVLALPLKKDFGEMSNEEIKVWSNKKLL
jgi:DNA primase